MLRGKCGTWLRCRLWRDWGILEPTSSSLHVARLHTRMCAQHKFPLSAVLGVWEMRLPWVLGEVAELWLLL